MISRIPPEKVKEWSDSYHDLVHDNPQIILTERLTKEEYIAHCGALWGYTRGVLAIQSVYNSDPELV
jgi:hypothetical protein